MKIWIDTANGAWGEVNGDQGRLVIVDLERQAARDIDAGLKPREHDAFSLVAALEDMSDTEVAEYGDRFGHLAS